MPAHLQHNSYGKSAIRLTKVVRTGKRHELLEMSVNVLLEGDFAESYKTGDNRKIVATDSMKNTVYVLARENQFSSIEDFAGLICRHFRKTYAQIESAEVAIAQPMWQRIESGGEKHPHAFVSGGSEMRICSIKNGNQGAQIIGGLSGLSVLKTTDSEFSNFVTDRYRTLKDASDRIFATSVEARWTYGENAGNFNDSYAAIRAALLSTFAAHYSLSVQQTLLAMGEAALAACSAIDDIEIKLPNQHRIPFNLEPFGLKNENEIFVPTDEPFGLITGRVTRK